jgi:hypothetical protein
VLAAEIELADLRKQFVATSEEIAKDLSLMVGRIETPDQHGQEHGQIIFYPKII